MTIQKIVQRVIAEDAIVKNIGLRATKEQDELKNRLREETEKKFALQMLQQK